MREESVPMDAKAAFFGALLLVGLASLIDSGGLAWMLAPLILILAIYAMARVPLRVSMLTIMFFALTLENPAEMPAGDAWKSPFYMFGAVMLVRLKKSAGFPLPISGMDILFVAAGVIWLVRRLMRSKIDLVGSVPTPKPLIQLALLSLGMIAFMCVTGLARGGSSDVVQWQIDRVFYLPLVFLLFQAALRGPRDHAALARIVLAAAALRSCQALYVYETVRLEPDPNTGIALPPAYGTTHHDSMLFAAATVILVALILHRAGGSTRWLVIVLGPILFFGMMANQRRMVWVQILAVLSVLYFLTAMNPFKRKLQKVALILSPFVLLYLRLGWNRSVGIFKPVSTIRSAIDSDTNASTQWRDVENFDLLFTIRQNPIFGTGYGHGFIEMIPLPPVDYLLERFIPHNSILGLWAYGGYVGYTGLTLLWGAGVYFSIRAYHAVSNPRDKVAAIVAFCAIPIHYLQCYGDMGLGSWTGVFLMAPALAAGGKLAVAAGAWPADRSAAELARSQSFRPRTARRTSVRAAPVPRP